MKSQERSVALLDIDGTLMPKNRGIFGVGEALVHQGRMSQRGLDQMIIARSRLNTPQGDIRKLAYEDYAELVLNELARGLEGNPQADVYDIASRTLLEQKDTFYPYGQRLIDRIRPTHDTLLVTANADFYAEVFTRHFKVDGFKATVLETEGGLYTGRVANHMTRSEHKHQATLDVFKKYSHNQSIALGDSEGDAGMLSLVEIPVAVDPDEKLLEQTQSHWIVATPETVESQLYSRLGLNL